MPKAVILTVDDETQVLHAVERDLRRAFGNEYRILSASSGAEALETVKRLKQRNAPLALFLVDQRMPKMTGVEFLSKAIQYYPEARKVLLTAYADTNAAIASINQIGLDYYLMKPWDPPEIHLVPVLTDLLRDWAAASTPLYEGIRVAGTQWSASCHSVKDFLARNQIPYQWIDIEQDEQTRQLIHDLPGEGTRLPVVFFPNGDVLVAPEIHTLAEKVGLLVKPNLPFYDLVIIGGGPAGLGAAVYSASEGLHTLIIEKDAAGGQAGTSSKIENYLGFPHGLSGAELARRATIQARRFGAEILTSLAAEAVRVQDNYRYIRLTNGEEITCHALLIATGVSVRRLEAPGVEQLTGAGIYYGAAITEAAYYRGQEVAVIGGGNSAGQAAMFLAMYASQVTLILRGSSLEAGMSQYLVDQICLAPNIRVMLDCEVAAALSDPADAGASLTEQAIADAVSTGAAGSMNRLRTLILSNHKTQETIALPCAAAFLFIGAMPHTALVGDLVQCDPNGYILTGPDLIQDGKRPPGWTLKRDPFLLETSCPGIFAAGDVRHGSTKRIGSAVGEGAVSVALVHQYLKTV